MNRPRALLLSLLLTALAVSSAFAAPRDNPSRIVSYGDLDLSTAAGVKALHRRLGHAANQICLDASGPAPAASVGATCRAEAWGNARARAKSVIARQQPSAEPYSTSNEKGE